MKRQNVIIFFLLCIFLGSCIFPKDSSGISFAASKELQADSIVTPPVLLSVTRMFIARDMLVVYEQQKDTLFSFWKLPDCGYLFSGGTKGQGPNDFLMLDKVFVETDAGFKTFEIATNKVKEIRLNKEKGSLELLSQHRLDVEQMPLNRFVFLADSAYCFLSHDEKYEYALLDKNHQIRYFSDYPIDMLSKKEEDTNMFLYNKMTVAKPDGKKFAAFYAYVRMLRIYDAKGKLLREVVMEKATPIEDDKRIVYYSSQPYASDKYIYILNTSSPLRKSLEVWSWDGDPVAEYLLDKNISTFAVSEKYKKLYAVDKDKEDVIYTYDLPE